MSYSPEKILVPIDLSQTSLNALDTAIAFARKKSAQLFLLNVVEPNYSTAKHNEPDLDDYLASEDVLTALVGSIQNSYGLQPKLIQKEGIVHDIILRTSMEEQADLIIMGSSGASGFRNGYTGTNAYLVMKYAGCPVLLVPPMKKFLNFKRAVFPIRPVAGALRGYEVLCHFVSSQSTLDVLGLSYRNMERGTKVLEKIADEIKEQANSDNVTIRTVWGEGMNVAEDVLYYANQNLTDLIVVTNILDVTSKFGFVGPYTQAIIHNSKVPVLNIKTSKFSSRG